MHDGSGGLLPKCLKELKCELFADSWEKILVN